MAVHYLQTTPLMIVIYLIFTRQTSATTEEFRVSVPENVAVGQAIFTLPRTQLRDKAELPCTKMDGDPHFRFNVTKNCTILVANPLDWSVESAYLLNIHRGLYSTSVEVQLTDVMGYPPVYNETCETPTNPKGRVSNLLFSFTSSEEVLTTNGDVLYIKQRWKDDFFHGNTYDPWRADTNNSDCTFHLATYTTWADTLITLKDIYDNGVRQPTCSVGSDNHDLLGELFWTLRDDESRLQKYPKSIGSIVNDMRARENFILFLTCIFHGRDAKLYSCNFPTFLHPPVRAFHGNARIEIASIEYADIEVRPIGCPIGKYGFFCNKNCICKNGARCHGFNGACKCAPGWKGVACDIPKPDVSITTTPSDPRQIYTSRNVAFHCRAHNLDTKVMSLRFPNGSEKLVSGENHMSVLVANIQLEDSGYYICVVLDKDGLTLNASMALDVHCLSNRKGADCHELCDCLQGASCDRRAGCVCPPGWTGTRCQTKCPRGTYGKDCTKRCSCQNEASCSPSGGRCNCTDGWYGNNCGKPCPSGLFGWRCQQPCVCKNNATCNNVDGSCTCVTPWTGRYCDQLQTSRDQPLLEILIPLGSLVLLVAIVTTILFKTGFLAYSVPDTGEEEKILFELRRMEQDLAQTLQPGWLGRWEKKARHLTPGPLIGEGMFGKVRRAQLRTAGGQLDLDVAAKAVRVEDAQSYRDFYREAAILVAVHQVQGQDDNDRNESNIVRLVGLITKSAEKYILLEYAPKGDLLGFLRGIKNNNQEYLLENLLGYAVHVARALQELERLRIAHRDVAARNVLITADDVAKLADFGLARDVYATTQYVRANRPGLDELLPLKWMALESIETGEYTCQSDVWSFGVLLWEIATLGQDPCYDGRMQLTFLQMVGVLRQGIRMNRPPECPEDLYRLMRACWRDVPATRPTPEGIEKRLLQLRRALLPPEAIQIETAL
ncbi:PREDICTED: tyrosine-protein kinase receptor Tie-1-like [Branchiostoma belcheri]|uniref:receptor protein-tyrosine kinase n=1 Tax=Branchiostoma belcheri TaxID=7741 RepID=A0A6P4ZT19_BRABE|nr:PREDICTED: tyrosine-protein kinase receptor Tie-1-like [Branchiostoma belcheri]